MLARLHLSCTVLSYWCTLWLLRPLTLCRAACCDCSFGVVMWELWSGQEPFADLQPAALLFQLTRGLSLPVPGSAEWGGDEPAPPEPAPGYASLMRSCWAPPEQRPSACQLVKALDGMLEQLRQQRRGSS